MGVNSVAADATSGLANERGDAVGLDPDTGIYYAGAHPEGNPEPRKEQRYSWIGDYLSRLDGKEARDAYYWRLESYATSPTQ